MSEDIEQTKRVAHSLIDVGAGSIIEQGKNTQATRDELIATDEPILIFVARLMELRADIDAWCE